MVFLLVSPRSPASPQQISEDIDRLEIEISLSCENVERVKGIEPSLSAWELQEDQSA
jgi:hypothetical protein